MVVKFIIKNKRGTKSFNDPKVKKVIDTFKNNNSAFVQGVIKFGKTRGYITNKQLKALKEHREYSRYDPGSVIWENSEADNWHWENSGFNELGEI